ncbi:hypothetical protein CEXT_386821 [Caerostris extrusa]|uniref:Uncharacterized protein n=1 Tax=Caerostris extrusa TaxID=172846 RepID=A0AAV4NKU1_CAEEX|nr:hypothetical protein CEXT_386821 [Caerostris extrusa]
MTRVLCSFDGVKYFPRKEVRFLIYFVRRSHQGLGKDREELNSGKNHNPAPSSRCIKELVFFLLFLWTLRPFVFLWGTVAFASQH